MQKSPKVSRSERLSEEIFRVLSVALQRDVSDPDIGMITITRVDLTRDLSLARVYYTGLAQAPTDDQVKAIGRATGFLRTKLANTLTIRSVPRLEFRVDTGKLKGDALHDLLRKVLPKESDDSDEAN